MKLRASVILSGLLVAALVVGLLALTKRYAGSDAAAARDVCEQVDPPTLPEQFIPFELRRASPPSPPVRHTGTEISAETIDRATSAAIASAPDAGIQLQYQKTEQGATLRYVGAAALGDDQTEDEFLRDGGFVITSTPGKLEDQEFAEYLRTEFPDRVVAVQVGKVLGAMVWADPNAVGARSYNVFWSDGTSEYSVMGALSAESSLAMAVSIACTAG